MYKVDYEYGTWFVYKGVKRISKPFSSFAEAEAHLKELGK